MHLSLFFTQVRYCYSSIMVFAGVHLASGARRTRSGAGWPHAVCQRGGLEPRPSRCPRLRF